MAEELFFPLIVAHNAEFDVHNLVFCFSRHSLTGLVKTVIGFSDTIKLFKKAHQPSYIFQDLAKTFAPDL